MSLVFLRGRCKCAGRAVAAQPDEVWLVLGIISRDESALQANRTDVYSCCAVVGGVATAAAQQDVGLRALFLSPRTRYSVQECTYCPNSNMNIHVALKFTDIGIRTWIRN